MFKPSESYRIVIIFVAAVQKMFEVFVSNGSAVGFLGLVQLRINVLVLLFLLTIRTAGATKACETAILVLIFCDFLTVSNFFLRYVFLLTVRKYF